MVSTLASHQEGPKFDSQARLILTLQSCVCFLHISIGFLKLPPLPAKNMHDRAPFEAWTNQTKGILNLNGTILVESSSNKVKLNE